LLAVLLSSSLNAPSNTVLHFGLPGSSSALHKSHGAL
jgi:hypothetical protein